MPKSDVFVVFGIRENLEDNEKEIMLVGTQRTEVRRVDSIFAEMEK